MLPYILLISTLLVNVSLCSLVAPRTELEETTDGTEEVNAESAQEYLGQYTFFRGWRNRRRLFLVRADDATVDRVRREAVYGFRCQLALRNINLSK